MQITDFGSEPIKEFTFLNAGRGPGGFYVDRLPVHIGQVSNLPDSLDAILCTADLQGRKKFEDNSKGPPRLLGEVLPDQLVTEILPQFELEPERVGVLLAGDFYTVPNLDQRGGSGDVTVVWRAFSQAFKWIVGVAGNHDMFGSSVAPTSRIAHNSHYLDGDRIQLDGLSIAGVGGIVGNPRKPHRKTDQEFDRYLTQLISPAPDVLVMHDGPEDRTGRQRGSAAITQTLNGLDPTLIVRGHAHWNDPLVELENGTQVLNVDCRVAVLCR